MKNLKKGLFYFMMLSIFLCGKCSSDLEYDATELSKNTELKEGLNPILKSKSGNLELNIKAIPNEKPQYVILENGKPIESVPVKKGTTCWECGVASTGDRHCWKVTCPTILGPWDVNANSGKMVIKQ